MEDVKMSRIRPKSKKEDTTRLKQSSSEGIFTKWVFPAVVSSLMETTVFALDREVSSADEEDLCKEEITAWLRFKKASLKRGKLKKIVRQRVPSPVRKRLWQEASGGCNFMSETPNLYHELCEKLFGKDNEIPDEVPSCPLVIDTQFMSYYLNADGVLILRKMLYVLSYLHPDVTYSPLLEAVAAIFLHFMEEVWCFACLSSMLSSKLHYFDQTQSEVSLSAAGFQHCVNINMKPILKRLRSFVINRSNEIGKQLIFPSWQKMIFEHVEFTVLVRIIDCFLVEGQKVLYRSGMMLLKIFYDYSLAYEKIGCPTAHDLCLAIGQHSEILTMDPNDFITASLKIRLKRKSINKGLEVNAGLVPADDNDTNSEKEVSMVFGTDLRELTDVMTTQQWRKLISWLPIRIQLLQPYLVFSTEKDGYKSSMYFVVCRSLKTLYTKAEEEEQTLILITTTNKEVFGAYLSCPLLHRHDGRKNLTFFGTGETFLFTIRPNTIPFKWVGIDVQDGHPMKRNISFVLIEHKPRDGAKRKPSMRRAVHRFSRASYKVPHSFSSKDFRETDQSYGGIPKNQSVLCLRDLPEVFLEDPKQDASISQPHKWKESEKSETRKPEEMFKVGNDDSFGHAFTVEERRIVIDETDNPNENLPNDVFIAGDDECLIVGGGGGYGLWVDHSLDRGRSETCYTFKNHPLTACKSGDFQCSSVEVFGFKSTF